VSRIARILRNTRETQIHLNLNLKSPRGYDSLTICWTWWRATAVLI
jgi:hypothetical protein